MPDKIIESIENSWMLAEITSRSWNAALAAFNNSIGETTLNLAQAAEGWGIMNPNIENTEAPQLIDSRERWEEMVAGCYEVRGYSIEQFKDFGWGNQLNQLMTKAEKKRAGQTEGAKRDIEKLYDREDYRNSPPRHILFF